jgi:tryptophan synthase alpha subunit
MSKEQLATIVLTVLISVVTGIVSGSVVVTRIESDVKWITLDIRDHESRIRALENKLRVDH